MVVYSAIMFIMNNKILNPQFVLRIGLAGVFLYAGLSSLMSPDLWIGFIPTWVSSIIPADIFLLVHGIMEVVLAFLLVGGVFLPFASFVAFADLLSIILFFGIDEVTFRDFGLLAAALALYLLSKKR